MNRNRNIKLLKNSLLSSKLGGMTLLGLVQVMDTPSRLKNWHHEKEVGQLSSQIQEQSLDVHWEHRMVLMTQE